MKTEVVDLSPTRKEVRIEIEPAVVRESYDRVSDRYVKQVNVPGFRPGRAPLSVVRTRFKNEIVDDVLRDIVPEAVNSAIDKHELAVIGKPDVQVDNTDVKERFGDLPISVHVNCEVLPDFQLGKYRGLEVVRRVRAVSDADVERMIEGLREASASLQPVEDRGAQLGDTVTVTFHGKFLDVSEEDIDVADADVVLGGEGVQQEFTDNLLGARPDEERTFVVNYPPDFSAQGLAGKRVSYNALVTAVRVKELPEIDDEWARSLGDEFDSIATLRTKVREDLEARAQAEADRRLRKDVIARLLENHRFEVPHSLIEVQTDHHLHNFRQELIGKGFDPRTEELNWESWREELKGPAEEDVRISMLLERIAEQEKLDVSPEEIDAEISAIADAVKRTKEQVRAILTKEEGERSIANRLRNRKAVELLIENARITEDEWRDETAEQVHSVASPDKGLTT